MKVATLAETVTVTGTSPVIDTTSANVAVNLSEQLLQGTPGGRDIWALVEYKVPSLLITRPDVGGTSGGLQGTYNARGTTSAQNSQYLNGVNVGDPAAIGAAGYYYDFDAFEDIQVSTGAHDITVPTSGVFLNMVTKSGGDRWSGRGTFTWLGDATQSQNIDDDLLRYGFRPETNAVDFVSDINVSGGGPLIENKLRMFGSLRDWRVHVNVPAAFSTLVLDKTDITSDLINADYQINDKNRLKGFYSKQWYKKPNRFLTAPTTVLVEESTSNEDDVFDVYQVLWNSVVTSRFFVDARLGLNKILFPTYLNGNDQTLLDNATSIRTRNFNTDTERFRDRLPGQRHRAVLRGRGPGRPPRVQVRLRPRARAGRSADTACRRRGVALQQRDRPRGRRHAVRVAVLLEDRGRRHGAVCAGQLLGEAPHAHRRRSLGASRRLSAGASQPGQPWFPELPRSFPEQRDIVNWKTIGPRLSAAYDLSGNGRTALKASAGRYYYVIATGGVLDTANPNANYSEQLHVERQQRRSAIPARRTDGDAGHLAGAAGDDFVRSGLPSSLHRRIHRWPRPRAVAGAAAQRRLHLPAREGPAGLVESRAALFDHAVDTRPTRGRDGVAGTADDTTFQFYDRPSAVEPHVLHQRSQLPSRPTRDSRSRRPSGCRTGGRCWPATRSATRASRASASTPTRTT